MKYRASFVLVLLASCLANPEQTFDGPRGVRFTDYSDSMTYATATWLVTDALLRVYPDAPLDALVVDVNGRSDYREGIVEVGGKTACDRFVSFAHNAGHVMRDIMEGDPDAAHHDPRFFGPGSVEDAPRNTLCPNPNYVPKD